MDNALYRRYLEEYVKEAFENSDGTNGGVCSYLYDKQIKGFLVQHKVEKTRALNDARKAFEEHRHWPVDIVLSQLGVDFKVPAKK